MKWMQVVLANYATEHAPFAIKAMNKGLNVISEVLPCQTLKEAVELVETVESTGMKYYYLENYCYMPAPAEMKRLYKEGKIGEFRYGECEYVHNCETIWHRITRGDKNHWRNICMQHFIALIPSVRFCI
jgi:predicted dehydrogenase